jgi:hypothetical protein
LRTIQFQNEIIEKTKKIGWVHSLSGTLLSPIHFPNRSLNWNFATASICDLVVLINIHGIPLTYEHLGPGMELDSGSSKDMDMETADA